MDHFSTPDYNASTPTHPDRIHLPPYSPKTRPLSQGFDPIGTESRSGLFPSFTAPPPYQPQWTAQDSYAQWQHSRNLDTPRQQYLSRRRHSKTRFCLCLFLSLFFTTVFIIVVVIEIIGRTQRDTSNNTTLGNL